MCRIYDFDKNYENSNFEEFNLNEIIKHQGSKDQIACKLPNERV